eukprot:8467818-Alexandrium_andersonii.AAC.1
MDAWPACRPLLRQRRWRVPVGLRGLVWRCRAAAARPPGPAAGAVLWFEPDESAVPPSGCAQ